MFIESQLDVVDVEKKIRERVKKQMEKYGYDLVFDLHGDEGCKKHFLVHSYGCKPPYFDIINKKIINEWESYTLVLNDKQYIFIFFLQNKKNT